MNITPKHDETAGSLVDLIASHVGNNRAIHPETAISASAWLAGSLLLRSFKLNLDNLDPGAIVLSHEANEKGPMLVNLLAGWLSASNVQVDHQKLNGQQEIRGEPPHVDILSALSQLQTKAMEIGKHHHLDLEQTAQAGALATAFIVKECAPQIGAETGFSLAISGFIEGSKTVPPRVACSSQSPAVARPWYKLW